MFLRTEHESYLRGELMMYLALAKVAGLTARRKCPVLLD